MSKKKRLKMLQSCATLQALLQEKRYREAKAMMNQIYKLIEELN